MARRLGRLMPLATVGAVLATVAPLLSHAVVYPEEAPPGAYQKYVLRVPNERDVPTVRVELEFAAEVTVVSFAEVPGWALEVRRDGAGRVQGAAWSGRLPVGRFVEFPFVAVNPREETRLRWAAWQEYEGGERVAWTGPEGSEAPASFTLVRASDGRGSGSAATIVAASALILALLSLGLVLRSSRAA